MSTEAWKFSVEAYAVAGNSACADCGATELLTWASSIVSDDFTVVLCNECCGGHRALGVHLSKPLSIKMDKWTDEQMQKLLQTGNAKVNEVFEAHESAASKKPAYLGTSSRGEATICSRRCVYATVLPAVCTTSMVTARSGRKQRN